MTFAIIRSLVLQRLDENTSAPESWTLAEVNAAINEAQMFLVLLTLCLENKVTFNLAANTVFYDPFAQVSDWIVPLRVRSANVKVRPAKMAELDALSSTWRTETAPAVKRYGTRGFALLYTYPVPSGSGQTLELTYAQSPAVMVNDGDVPQIPEQHHPALADYGIYRLRQKLGGSEFQKGLPLFASFIESAKQLGAFVRARSLDQRYDTLPVELAKLDISRALKIRKDLLPAKQETPSVD
jgi:hypothetical protein